MLGETDVDPLMRNEQVRQKLAYACEGGISMASLCANAAVMSQSEGHSEWHSISAVCSVSMPEVLCSRDALLRIDKSCCAAPLVSGEMADLVKVESSATSLSF